MTTTSAEVAKQELRNIFRVPRWIIVTLVVLGALVVGSLSFLFAIQAIRIDYLVESLDTVHAQQAVDQSSDEEAAAHYRIVYEACVAAEDCHLGSQVPTPAEVESDVATPSTPVAQGNDPIIVREALSASQVRTVARDAIEWYCEQDNQCEGEDGQPAPPTDPAEIAQAITGYCATGACQGPEGAPGANATVEQIAIAVANYCSGGSCVGPVGPTGPGPSDDQVLAAVQAYCSNSGSCAGPEGRGIESIYCGDDARWSVTYTDGEVSDAGQCRVESIIPPPEPSPEPGPSPEPPTP